jgi:hypothetical protein
MEKIKALLLMVFGRLKEPSTHATIFAVLGFFSLSVPADMMSNLTQIMVGISMVGTALLGIVLPEKKP